jgi:carboxypeptidase Q
MLNWRQAFVAFTFSCAAPWACAVVVVPLKPPAVGTEMLNRLADAEFNHGEVVETIAYLSDRIGGRMTNSPAMRAAETWAQEKFKSAGLANVHREGFEFGRGWWIEAAHVRMLAPRILELRSIPIAWTPSTNGPLTAPIIVAPIKTDKDFAEWKGKLAGKIVLTSWPGPAADETEPAFKRFSDEDLKKLDQYQQPTFDPEADQRFVKERLLLARKLDAFLAGEGALASVKMSRADNHLIHGEGYEFQVGATPKLPSVEVAAEDYRKLARLAKTGEVRIEIDSRVHYEDADTKAYNVIADLRGADPKAGYVMAGAHLDSWVAADGAADNGAGSAIMLETARLLSSLGIHPRRTIRFALWAGEEQGLYGSAAYLDQHLAHRPPPSDPQMVPFAHFFNSESFPVEMLPEASSLAGYFNIDNGSGKIRGIYTEGNFAVVPTFREWLAPLGSLGVNSVVARPTGGTDHVLMQEVGLPAFQFIQDPLDYMTEVHHTDVDTFDHLRLADMRQAVVVLASVLLDAANSDTPLPRKPVPTQPRVTDPFHYKDPAVP